jgi:phosphoribosyl 1,2-cyclic phosphodiesterase
MEPFCRTSNLAVEGGNPALNRNYRNNPSIVISTCTGTCPSQCSNVVIDAGKTFREAALRWFPRQGIASLDAIVLTHAHMDACGGLDDVRGFQKWIGRHPSAPLADTTQAARPRAIPMPLHVSEQCLQELLLRFPWLFSGLIQERTPSRRTSELPAPLPRLSPEARRSAGLDEDIELPVAPPRRMISTGSSSNNHYQVNQPVYFAQPSPHTASQPPGTTAPPPKRMTSVNARSRKTRHVLPDPVVKRHVASFDVRVFEPFVPVDVAPGIRLIPLPVMHGEDLISYGFAFTVGQTNVVYLSDISRMLPVTLDFIRHHLPPTDVLIVDTLHPTQKNPVHFSLEQAADLAHRIQPRQQTLLVGMNCDSFPPHDEVNEQLKREYGDTLKIQFAHDGLVINL